jgi:hypothetical protein
MGKAYRIEDARGRILAAVRGNVRKEGWEALTIRRIAERAGSLTVTDKGREQIESVLRARGL